MKKFRGKIKLVICVTLIMPLFLFVFKKDTVDHVDAATNEDKGEYETTVEEAEVLIPEITDEEITRLTTAFMDTLVQDIDENTYLVLNYKSKEDLLTAFESITTEKIGKLFIDVYYEEKEGGLYIIPTSTPPWFESENNYDVIQLDNRTVKVTQFNETDFYGDYQIELEFTFDESWTITDIVYP